MKLNINNAIFRLKNQQFFKIASFELSENDFTVIIGKNGSGKSAIAAAIAGLLDCIEGVYDHNFNHIEIVSFEQIQRFLNKEWDRDNSDMVTEDDIGRTAQEIILNDVFSIDTVFNQLVAEFQIEYLLARPFKLLSTGEMRKVFLCQKLLAKPDVLILDEPFDGLDIASRTFLIDMLNRLNDNGLTIILILNRFSDLPERTKQLGVVVELELVKFGIADDLLKTLEINQLADLEKLSQQALPNPPINAIKIDPNINKIVLNNGKVAYDTTIIFNNLNWRVKPNEHWHILGENGAGKSTLLSLISGDHPQGYANDLTLFGIKRGSGETIWDIKKHIGYVSSSFHQSYKVRTSVKNVVISGFYDSIGVYQSASEEIIGLTNQWFEFLGWTPAKIQAPFQSLSWGEQRLILIVRAFVKHPSLLILDEPFQGLDPLNREWVKHWITEIVLRSNTQLLFVSHHSQDAPSVITHRLKLFKNKPAEIEIANG